jgi:hypothetical protein
VRQTEYVTYIKGIQAPGTTLPNEAENAANVIRKDDAREPGAVDEPCSLEDLFVLIRDLS